MRKLWDTRTNMDAATKCDVAGAVDIALVLVLILFTQTLDYNWQKQDQIVDCMTDQYTDPTTEAEVLELVKLCGANKMNWSMEDYE